MMNALVLAATMLFLQDAEKIHVKDGKAPGVFYGLSLMLDLWGNTRHETWTLRPDGVLFWGAPREPFEDFAKRALTDDEKKVCSRYEIRGAEIRYTYPGGRETTGEVELNADSSIKTIKGEAGMTFFPIRYGVPFELTGYWSNSQWFNSGGARMYTSTYSNLSCFKGGLFVHESGAATICTAIQERTSERRSGDTVFTETVREEVARFYGSDAKSKMGKFRVSGSALILVYDDGKKDSWFIGTIPSSSKNEAYTILLGGTLFTGTPGTFPKPTGGAANPVEPPPPPPPQPPPPAVCKTPQFELQAPAGWSIRDQDELHFLVPDGVDRSDPFVLILLGTTLTTKVTDPALAKEFEDVVKGLAKGATVKPGGDTVKLTIDGVDAVRIPYAVEHEGKSFRVEATCAIRDGNALVALALGSETAMKKFGDPARAMILVAKIAGAGAKVKIAADRCELEMPQGWKGKETDQGGLKVTMLVPPGRDVEGEYAAFVLATAAGAFKSATEKAAIADLREMIGQVAAGTQAQGEPETLKADGEPAVLLKYAGKNEAGDVVVAHAFMVVKHGQAVILMVAGKEKLATEHAAAMRAGFESIKVKK